MEPNTRVPPKKSRSNFLKRKQFFFNVFEDARVLLTPSWLGIERLSSTNLSRVRVIYPEGIHFCASATYRGLRFAAKMSPLNSFI